MGSVVQCYWLEPTDRVRLHLRRYRATTEGRPPCSGTMSYCNALTPFGEHPTRKTLEGYLAGYDDLAPPKSDPLWPTKCPDCGYEFVAEKLVPCDCGKPGCMRDVGDPFQVFQDLIYRRTDTGEVLILDDAPDGAMWDAWWMSNRKGPDGRSLMVKVPGGHNWCVDGRASNCTMPDDDEHRCWVRHGDPSVAGSVHVDKDGRTCGAGAGSIQAGKYHGFLRHGRLEEC